MKHFRFIISLLPFLVVSLTLNGQISRFRQGASGSDESTGSQNQQTEKEKSSLSPDTARTFFYTLNPQAAYSLLPFKAKLHNFHHYSFLQNNEIVYTDLGNPGSAATPLFYHNPGTCGFRFRSDAFQLYRYSLDSVRFFVLEKPYSEINYVMGKAKEQQLLFTHSQQVRKGLTLGLHVRYANSPGLYLRQRTYYATGYFTLSYILPSARYGIHAAYLNDRSRNYENGGIAFDSVFRDNTESNRKTISVNLGEAMNRSKDVGYLLQHYFNIQRSRTVNPDSLTVKKYRKFNVGRIVHTFKYSRETSAYLDGDTYSGILSGFYPQTYADSAETLDSTFHVHLENLFVYSNIEPDTSERSFPFQYAFGVSHQFDRIGYGNTGNLVNRLLPASVFSSDDIIARSEQSKSYSHLMPFGTLKGIIARKTYFIAEGRLSLGGYGSGDYELKGRFYQAIGTKSRTAKIYLVAAKGLKHPDYFYHSFVSNHFRWDKELKVQDLVSASAGIEAYGFNLGISIDRISNFVYLNTEMQPVQIIDGLTIMKSDVSKIFRPGRWMLDTRITLQEVSRDSALQLPGFTAQFSLSYNLLLFKKVLLAEAGISGYYHSKYYADAYMPALCMFYRQDAEKFGNYPFLDAFINMKIKRARIFIKYQHFNAGWFGYTYFKTPHYPGADAAFKTGVSWVFYD